MDWRRRELVLSLFLSNSEATIAFGKAFAEAFKRTILCRQSHSSCQKPSSPLLLFLEGDLAAGKTHFAKGMIHALTKIHVEDIPSPTFSLKLEYSIPQSNYKIVHADLYRLAEGSEIFFEDLLEDFYTIERIVLIEWPKSLPQLFIKELSLPFYYLFFNHEEDGRSLELWYDGLWIEGETPYIDLQQSLLGALS